MTSASMVPSTQGTAVQIQHSQWYAVHTRCKHEKRVEAELREKGITAFLPVVRQVHRWSDRRKIVDLPLFPCYAFVNVIATSAARVAVLQTPGVLQFVAFSGLPAPIDDGEIDRVRRLVRSEAAYSPHPFLLSGQKVRIRGGALDGVEGVLATDSRSRTLVVSINLIKQSMAVSLEGYDVEPI